MTEKLKVPIIQPREARRPLLVKKAGRNEKCSCGSGKKQKQCCGVESKYFTK